MDGMAHYPIYHYTFDIRTERVWAISKRTYHGRYFPKNYREPYARAPRAEALARRCARPAGSAWLLCPQSPSRTCRSPLARNPPGLASL
jgi:hypothetical protein